MTNINDLQERINSAEAVLDVLKADLEDLKKQEQEQEPESLFGRWATHPTHGRVLVSSHVPNQRFQVRVYPATGYGNTYDLVDVRELKFDPGTLTTEQDFQDAPEGTIVEAPMYPKDVAVKTEDGWYRTGGMHAIAVEYMPTCRVIRWGEGK